MIKDIEIDPDSNLFISEVNNLQKLQNELDFGVPRISKFDFDKTGFVEEAHHITELQLLNINLSFLPDSIGHFYNLKKLNLTQNSLQSIDLTPLKQLKHLEILDLKKNQLQSIDLTPLSYCTKFEILDLRQNKLREIDLTPLQDCPNLYNLILESNQLQTIDLSPLLNCTQLRLLDLNNNQLRNISLEFLHQNSALWSLDLTGNPLTTLNITPLLSLPRLELFSIDDHVSLEAFPVHRDYSKKQRWFVSEYLPHVKWIMTKEDTQYESLFGMYQMIEKHFRHDEFWADYRDRHLTHPPQPDDESSFFEYAVQRYMTIKDQQRTKTYDKNAEQHDIRTPWRKEITTQLQNQFVNVIDLASSLKQYWEPGSESRLIVDLVEEAPLEDIPPEVIVLHFWLGHEPSQLLRVSTFTWIRISVDEDTRSYQVQLGFNRGFLRAGKKYHPIPPPEEFPADVFTTTEVMYEIKSFTTTNALDIITRGHEWLKQGYYPKFDPEWPENIYEGLSSRGV